MPAAVLIFEKSIVLDIMIHSMYCEETSMRKVIIWKTESWGTYESQVGTHLPFLQSYITHHSFNAVLEETMHLMRRPHPRPSKAKPRLQGSAQRGKKITKKNYQKVSKAWPILTFLALGRACSMMYLRIRDCCSGSLEERVPIWIAGSLSKTKCHRILAIALD